MARYLYEDGWRQGTVLRAVLPADALHLGENGEPERRTADHSVWVVATQDCDLLGSDAVGTDPTIELRPAFEEGPPPDWGIRSRRLRVSPDLYMVAESPRVMVTPALLSSLGPPGEPLVGGRALAFKTWLGLRYDRPAVPEDFVELGRAISREVERRGRPGTIGDSIRDVLMQFDGSTAPPKYSLFAIVDDLPDHPAPDMGAVREWLAEIALGVPHDLGVADRIEAAIPAFTSLQLIETSYAADVTQVTWRGEEPRGAV